MSTTSKERSLLGFSGEILTPSHDRYDDLRRVWNGSVDRRPAFILRCRTAQDVAVAVCFAARQSLPLAIRAGGHSVPGHSVCEGGAVIDLRPMNRVHVDPVRRTARVQPGTLWRQLDEATQRYWLATPGGEISDTGVAGLTLGGGIGWLSRPYGLAADNLIGAQLVTADGELVEVSDAREPDLMWGLRGGGGNFGVVTRFDFQLHEVGPFFGGMAMYAGDRSEKVLHDLIELTRQLPDRTAMVAALVCAPPAPFVPAPLVGRPVLGVAAAHFGDPAVGQRLLEPVRRIGGPFMDTFGTTSYVALQRMFDAGNPYGAQQYVKSDFLRAPDDAAVRRLVDAASRPSSAMNQILLRLMGGRISEVPAEATAFANRHAEYLLTVAATWLDPAQDPAPHRAWVRQTWQHGRRWACGTYVNHLGVEGAHRLREAYPSQTWTRLTRLKARWDPHNLFAMNQNIPPAFDLPAHNAKE